MKTASCDWNDPARDVRRLGAMPDAWRLDADGRAAGRHRAQRRAAVKRLVDRGGRNERVSHQPTQAEAIAAALRQAVEAQTR